MTERLQNKNSTEALFLENIPNIEQHKSRALETAVTKLNPCNGPINFFVAFLPCHWNIKNCT